MNSERGSARKSSQSCRTILLAKRRCAQGRSLFVQRGVIREQTTRRNTMFILLLVALTLLFSGTTFLKTTLNPREHPIWFVLLWIVCGWLTVTALLLAIFDLLIVKLESRRAQRVLRRNLKTNSPKATINE